MRPPLTFASLLTVLLAVSCLEAAVKPNALFSDNAVLERGMPVPVWGTASDGEHVTVTFQGQSVSTVAKNGAWQVVLDPLDAGGPFEMTIAGENSVRLQDILVGEVWVCSGQSNMFWPLRLSENGEQAVASALNPQLRLFSVPRAGADEPQRDLVGQWSECNAQSAEWFSAVAYYFGRDLQRALGVPIGLIHSSFGGTRAEAWTPLPALASNPETETILAEYAKAAAKFTGGREEYDVAEAKLSDWLDGARDAMAHRKPFREPLPPMPPMCSMNPRRPGALYHAMVCPLQPYAIRGVIWYQGESNTRRAWQYRTLFPMMIERWRADWKQGDFPFLFVQLAPYWKRSDEEKASKLAELREAQLYTAKTVANTAMAVAIDCGSPDGDIHPLRKQPVGTRLALSALAVAYGRPVAWSGPIYKKATFSNGKATIAFEHVDGGLAAQGEELLGFTVAGKDGVFVEAEAKIEGDTVVVASPAVSRPAAVRYGWANYPTCNLTNKAGLPASPFRTDSFRLTTERR